MKIFLLLAFLHFSPAIVLSKSEEWFFDKTELEMQNISEAKVFKDFRYISIPEQQEIKYFENKAILNNVKVKNINSALLLKNELQFLKTKQQTPNSYFNMFSYFNINNQKTDIHKKERSYKNRQELLIPSGVYSPFTARINNQHKFVKSFIIDKFPVTNFDFLQFVKENKEWRRSLVPRIFADTSYLAHWSSDLKLSQFSDKNSPVTRVSWFAANAYCESLGKHLPTIDQWEYVAENKSININLIDTKILNWYLIPSSSSATRIGSYEKNVYGVSDFYASIWEWTEDFNSVLITQDWRLSEEKKNSSLFCGAGAIGLDPSRYVKFTRYSMRDSLRANYVVTSLGFRCARQN